MLKRVLTRVDFPRPDSPEQINTFYLFLDILFSRSLTDNHDVKVEALANTLAVPLVRQVGETNVSGQLPADNVPHVASGLSSGLGVF